MNTLTIKPERKRIRITHKTFRETHVTEMGRHLDWANDAWLRSDGRISVRDPGNEFKVIGNVSHLRGAAKVACALKTVFDYRGR